MLPATERRASADPPSRTASVPDVRRSPVLPAPDRSPHFVRTALFLLCASVYLLSMSRTTFRIDGVDRFRLTRSIAERGSLVPESGPIKYGLGQSVEVLPLYWIGEALHIGPLSGLERRAVVHRSVNLLNQFITAGVVVAFFSLLLRLGFATGPALTAALVLALGTALLPYARTWSNEPTLALCLTLCVLFMVPRRGSSEVPPPSDFGVAGACAAWAGINNPIALPAAGLAFFALAYRRRDGAGALLRRAASFGAPSAVGLLVILWYNDVRFGSAFATGYELDSELVRTASGLERRAGFSTPLHVGLYGHLFSSGRSVFLYSPPLILAVFAWRRFTAVSPAARAAARAVAALAAFYLLVYSTWWAWYGGFTWGNRLLLPVLPLACLPLVVLAARGRQAGRPHRAWLIGAAAAGLIIQGLGIAVWHGRYVVSVLGRPLDNEHWIHFLPQYNPIVGQIRTLSNASGADLDFALADLPLTASAAVVVPLVALGAGSGLYLWRAARAPK